MNSKYYIYLANIRIIFMLSKKAAFTQAVFFSSGE